MIPGFNHNIKHQGRVYHVQTEDSGPKNPHVITHLFVGGNILASKKTTYAELLGQLDFEKSVRGLMEQQHKAMLRSLVNGAFDTAPAAAAPAAAAPASGVVTSSAPAQAAPVAAPAAVMPSASPATMTGTRPAVPASWVPSAPGAAASGTAQSPSQAPRPITGLPRGVDDGPRRDAPAFGEALISDKSLDQVILSYLAEDLADLE
jgi:hypothetical protein